MKTPTPRPTTINWTTGFKPTGICPGISASGIGTVRIPSIGRSRAMRIWWSVSRRTTSPSWAWRASLADRKLREADPEEGRAVEDLSRTAGQDFDRWCDSSRWTVKHGWALHNTKNRGVESYSYRIHFSDGLVASALWGKGIATGDGAPASILLLDEGKAKAGQRASDRINRGEQVLVADLILTGEAQPRRRNASDSHRYAQLLATVGDRPLGIRASHLLALAGWLKDDHAATEVRVEAQGFRSQVVALLSAALDPAAFSEVRVEKGMKSLRHLLAKPVRYSEAPELFCLGLFPEFDLKRLISLAKPVPVEQRFDSSDSGD